MLHTKFLENQLDFLVVYTKFGRGSHLDHVMRILHSYFCSNYPWRPHIKFGLHWQNSFVLPKPSLSFFKESLSYSGAVIWNSIPYEVENSSSLNCFVHNVLQWMNGS